MYGKRHRSRPTYERVDGINYSNIFDPDDIKTMKSFRICDDDVIVSTYPKSGTHWMREVIFLIKNNGWPQTDGTEFNSRTPFLDAFGPRAANQVKDRYAVVTHLLHDKLSHNSNAKYIYLARNPFDVCVSYYHHTKMLPHYHFNGTFDDIFHVFMDDENCEFGGYFNHFNSWWNHRNECNMLFMTYEAMKYNFNQSLLEIGNFLGNRYYEMMVNDGHYFQRIVVGSSFNEMRNRIDRDYDRLNSGNGTSSSRAAEDPPCVQFVRKGQVGGWREYFDDRQEAAMRAKFCEQIGRENANSLWGKLCDDWI